MTYHADDPTPIVSCSFCGMWAAAYTECGSCGAPVDPPFEEARYDTSCPLVKCDHCEHWQYPKTECTKCGAPVQEAWVDAMGWIINDSPYFLDSGTSFRSPVPSAWMD